MRLSYILPLLLVLSNFASSKPTLAVNALEASGVSASDAQIATDRLQNELIQTGAFRIMERSQMENILKEQGFQQSGACDNQSCQVQMGQLLGVDRIVVGQIGKIGNTYTISARVLDVGTGEILFSVSRDLDGKIDRMISEAIPDIARRIANPGPTQAAQQAGAGAPPSKAQKITRWSLYAFSALALGTGGYFAYAAQQDFNRADKLSAQYDGATYGDDFLAMKNDYNTAIDDGNSKSLIRNIALGAGSTALGVAVWLSF